MPFQPFGICSMDLEHHGCKIVMTAERIENYDHICYVSGGSGISKQQWLDPWEWWSFCSGNQTWDGQCVNVSRGAKGCSVVRGWMRTEEDGGWMDGDPEWLGMSKWVRPWPANSEMTLCWPNFMKTHAKLICQDGSEWVSGLRFLEEVAECFGDEKMSSISQCPLLHWKDEVIVGRSRLIALEVLMKLLSDFPGAWL